MCQRDCSNLYILLTTIIDNISELINPTTQKILDCCKVSIFNVIAIRLFICTKNYSTLIHLSFNGGINRICDRKCVWGYWKWHRRVSRRTNRRARFLSCLKANQRAKEKIPKHPNVQSWKRVARSPSDFLSLQNYILSYLKWVVYYLHVYLLIEWY